MYRTWRWNRQVTAGSWEKHKCRGSTVWRRSRSFQRGSISRRAQYHKRGQTRAFQHLVSQDLFIFHSKSQTPRCFSLSLHEQTQMFVRTADGDGRGSLPPSSAGLNHGEKYLFLEKAQFILQLSGLFGVFPLLRFERSWTVSRKSWILHVYLT